MARRREDVKITIVMPGFNAGRTLERTVSAIPPGWADDLLLVDDSSTDDTVEVARRLPLRVVWHPHNVGYGGNQKTCYLDALQHDADIVVMLHPDYQYSPPSCRRWLRRSPRANMTWCSAHASWRRTP